MENQNIKKDKGIALDRMRFEKNSLPAFLCYIAIVLNVLYFVSIYRTNQTYYYKYLLGISVIVNLVFMLVAFLCSEGIKNYKQGYGYIMFVLAAIEIVRIFIFPRIAHTTDVMSGKEVVGKVMETKQYLYTVGCLIFSSGALVMGGIIGILRTFKLNRYLATLENK